MKNTETLTSEGVDNKKEQTKVMGEIMHLVGVGSISEEAISLITRYGLLRYQMGKINGTLLERERKFTTNAE